MKTFKCRNIGNCDFADNNKILHEGNLDEVRQEINTYKCANCQKTLEEIDGGSGGKIPRMAVIGGGIAIAIALLGGGIAIAIALLGGGGYAIFGEKDTPIPKHTPQPIPKPTPQPIPKPDPVKPDISNNASGGIDLGVNTISKIEEFIKDLRDNKSISQSEVDAQMQSIIDNIDTFNEDKLDKLNVNIRTLEAELRMADMDSKLAIQALNSVRQKQGYTAAPKSKRR